MRSPVFTEIDIDREFELIEDDDPTFTLAVLGRAQERQDDGFDEPSLLERLG